MGVLKGFNKVCYVLLGGTVCLGTVMSAQGASTKNNVIEEIIVTAQKREASVQETPISITALSGETLAAEGVSTLEDIAAFTPGLVVGGNATFEFPIALRGVSGAAAGIGADAPTAIYVDGVYLGRPSAAVFDLVDLDRIEILRGPQGTLYGRNTVGGAISLYSKAPSDQFEAYVGATLSDLSSWNLKGSISGPLSDKVGYRLSASTKETDDWISNQDGTSVGGSSSKTIRGALSVNPSDSVALIFRGDYTDIEDPLMAKTIAITTTDPLTLLPVKTPTAAAGDFDSSTQSERVFQDRDMWGLSVQLDMDIGELGLTSISAYREGTSAAQFDADGLPARILRSGQGGPGEEQDQFTQEIRLTSPGGEMIDWIVGTYYFTESASYQLDVELLGAGTNLGRHAENETTNYAVFGQLDWNITDTVTVTAGLRFSDEEKKFSLLGPIATAGAFDPASLDDSLSYFPPLVPLQKLPRASWESWTPKLGINWQATEDIMAYMSFSKGFKSGGHNAIGGVGDPAFDPEKVSSWEVGVKSELLDNRVRMNGALFYYDYQNLQVRIPGPPGTTFIQNAAEAEIYGGEIELQVVPTDNLRLTAALSLLHSEYKDYTQGEDNPVAASGCLGGNYDTATQICDLSGNRLNRAPEVSYSVNIEYDFLLSNNALLTPRLSYQYEGELFYTEQNIDSDAHDGWESLNGRLTYTTGDGQTELSLFAKNLTDDRHYTHIIPIGANSVASGVSQPRTFGAEFSVRY